VYLPKGKRVISSKWIFKRKEGIPSVEAPRFKARLVARESTQVEGLHYNEILLSIGNQFDLEL
jgi:hypothetical protein